VAVGVVTHGAQKVDLAHVGIQRLNEVELAVSTLPQHEVAEPLLTRRSDDEVGIGLTPGIQVLANQFRREQLGERLHRSAVANVRVDNALHRIGNLATTAITNRKVDV
jgi:hypothetical protein